MDNIYLIGFMGAGKSMVGKSLSRITGRLHIDVDAEIEKGASKTIAEIFATDGEEAFRELERQLINVHSARTQQIVSLGGGAFCDLQIRKVLLSSGKVVFLDASLATLEARLAGSDRPMLEGKSGEQLVEHIEALLSDRRSGYEKAHLTVCTDHHTPEEIALTILEKLNLCQ
jgi:shikimate kinase